MAVSQKRAHWQVGMEPKNAFFDIYVQIALNFKASDFKNENVVHLLQNK